MSLTTKKGREAKEPSERDQTRLFVAKIEERSKKGERKNKKIK